MANNNSIQVLRGTNANIVSSEEGLLPGQPLYNIDKNYLTIGSGTTGIDKAPLTSKPIAVRELVGYVGDQNGTITDGVVEAASIRVQDMNGNVATSSILNISSSGYLTMSANSPMHIIANHDNSIGYPLTIDSNHGMVINAINNGVYINAFALNINTGNGVGDSIAVNTHTVNCNVNYFYIDNARQVSINSGVGLFLNGADSTLRFEPMGDVKLNSHSNINLNATKDISLESNTVYISSSTNTALSIASGGVTTTIGDRNGAWSLFETTADVNGFGFNGHINALDGYSIYSNDNGEVAYQKDLVFNCTVVQTVSFVLTPGYDLNITVDSIKPSPFAGGTVEGFANVSSTNEKYYFVAQINSVSDGVANCEVVSAIPISNIIDGNYPNMSVGNATNAQNAENANNSTLAEKAKGLSLSFESISISNTPKTLALSGYYYCYMTMGPIGGERDFVVNFGICNFRSGLAAQTAGFSWLYNPDMTRPEDGMAYLLGYQNGQIRVQGPLQGDVNTLYYAKLES